MPDKVKKLPELDVIHYLDVAQPRLLKKLLSNPTAFDVWIDVINTELEWGETQDLISLGYYNKVDPMLLAKATKAYVDRVVDDWTEGTTETSTNQMIASLPLFVEMSKYLPHVNPKEDYKIAFRGTDIPANTLIKFIKKNKKESDWKRVKVGAMPYMAYTGPKKHLFTYKPHNEVQSWSVSDKAASNFGSSILAVPIDKTFFFDPGFMNQYGFSWENETVHFGDEKMKVGLIVEYADYRTATLGVNRYNESNEEVTDTTTTIEVQDEDGTLTMPM